MEKAAWLAQVKETILEPELPICDPHHHLWDYPGSRYMSEELLLDIKDRAFAGHNVVSTVFVECNSGYQLDGSANDALAPVAETQFVVDEVEPISGEVNVAAGIVGFADLSLGLDVAPVLDAHLKLSPNRFRGIRHAAGWHQSDSVKNSHSDPIQSLMLSDEFRAGFALLEKHNLSFDAWFYHTQLSEFVDLAQAFPNTTIVLDHFGGPLGVGPYQGQFKEVFAQWRDSIAPLQDCKNVYFKLGGINMKVNGYDWHQQALPPTSDQLLARTAPYYEYCIEKFGSERCMFESNFPVDKESVSYHVLWNSFKKLSHGLSATDRANLFCDTATKVYRL